MKTDDLRAFDAVVRHGSISEAARALNLTQPAITRRIQSLEEALGAQLLDRSTKPPHPSVLGLRVHEQTKAALREIDVLSQLVASDGEPTGALRLGLTHSMGSTGLIEVLAGMQQLFPEVRMQISTDWSAQLLEKVQQGKLDAATVFLPGKVQAPEGLAGERLGATDVVLVAAKGQFAQAGARLRTYAEAGWVLNPEGCGFRAALQRKLADQGLRLRLNMETYGSELQLGLVAAGLGVGFVSRPAFLASRWREQLELLSPRDFSFAVDVWLLSPGFHGNMARAVAHFGAGIARGFAQPAARKPRRTS
ncbi:LysR family transcriptional regulator [Pelomonas sp. KK5]|uniref:LysR family transcriptional regulator n=1 Tax=Pelomonas sp. KK5 TaxID=1855730 RepID=UPI00097C6DA4|nr:LysR family transcriptional regulator [Pelomonas sp. KK5]